MGPGKLLIGSIGGATVSYVGGAASCGGQSSTSSDTDGGQSSGSSSGTGGSSGPGSSGASSGASSGVTSSSGFSSSGVIVGNLAPFPYDASSGSGSGSGSSGADAEPADGPTDAVSAVFHDVRNLAPPPQD